MTRNAATTQGKSTPQRSSMTSAQSGMERGQQDQERSIQTSRNADWSTSLSRAAVPLVRGIPASPFWLMRRIAEDMDHMLDDFGLSDRSGSSGTLDRGLWSPQVETFRRGDKIVVRADLPGLRKEDVKVELDDNVLSIAGERSDEHEDTRDGFYRSERSYGQFYRAVTLPEGVDGKQCEATFKNGVLEITIGAPKQEPRKAKEIEIQ
jgi:HSP20 family protein